MAFGNLTTISSNSPVILDAPTAPLPLDTMVTLLQADKGAATSAATYKVYWPLYERYVDAGDTELNNYITVHKHISMRKFLRSKYME